MNQRLFTVTILLLACLAAGRAQRSQVIRMQPDYISNFPFDLDALADPTQLSSPDWPLQVSSINGIGYNPIDSSIVGWCDNQDYAIFRVDSRGRVTFIASQEEMAACESGADYRLVKYAGCIGLGYESLYLVDTRGRYLIEVPLDSSQGRSITLTPLSRAPISATIVDVDIDRMTGELYAVDASNRAIQVLSLDSARWGRTIRCPSNYEHFTFGGCAIDKQRTLVGVARTEQFWYHIPSNTWSPFQRSTYALPLDTTLTGLDAAILEEAGINLTTSFDRRGALACEQVTLSYRLHNGTAQAVTPFSIHDRLPSDLVYEGIVSNPANFSVDSSEGNEIVIQGFTSATRLDSVVLRFRVRATATTGFSREQAQLFLPNGLSYASDDPHTLQDFRDSTALYLRANSSAYRLRDTLRFCKGDSVRLQLPEYLFDDEIRWSDGASGAQERVIRSAGVFTATAESSCLTSEFTFVVQRGGTEIRVLPVDQVPRLGERFRVMSVGEAVLANARQSWIAPDGAVEECEGICNEFRLTASQEGFVITKLTDEFGCEARDSIWVSPTYSLDLPNAFSPNGDGVNDAFALPYVAPARMRFRLFDRWGGLLAVTELSLGETQPLWDGAINGRPADVGVYIYTLESEPFGERPVLTGEVTLLR